MNRTSRFVAAGIAVAFSAGPALAASPVAGGSTTVGVSIVESTQLATGWSVKETLMGQPVLNLAGDEVGKVQDLIISPDKRVSYVIVGAGGFVGIGRHDVAIPVTQLEERAGKLVMAGATRDSIKALPRFEYATDTSRRDAFVATAERDVAQGKARVVTLEKQAGKAAGEGRARIDRQVAALNVELAATEKEIGAMNEAAASRWREFEARVSAATARLRGSVDAARG
jgi:hypothetical protein